MTSPRHDPDLDARLAELVSDAVSDLEPGEGLDSIRNRTKVTPMSARRPWLLATGGAVLATAAVLTAIAFAGGLPGDDRNAEPGPIGQTSQVPSATPTEPPASTTRAAYFVGETPSGPRLYREFQQAEGDSLGLLESGPLDPDYRTLWPQGAFAGLSDPEAGIVMVSLSDASYTLRPAGMSDDEAAMAIQQVIYTVQAQFQERLAVQFRLDGNPVAEVYGQPTSEPLTHGPVLQTLAHVSLTTPTEGQVVGADTLEISGVANSFEANVIVRLQRWEGTEILLEEPITAEGYMGEKLFPFAGSIDISDVPPGDYVLIAMTDDPSGGTEGGGAHTDSKRITVE